MSWARMVAVVALTCPTEARAPSEIHRPDASSKTTWVYLIVAQASSAMPAMRARTALFWRAVIEKCAPWRSAAAIVAWP